MSYLCRIRFNLENGDSLYQYYVTNDYELSKLKKLDHEFEDGCCSQGGCFVCTVGGCTVEYCDHIPVTNKELINFFRVSAIMKLDTLLDKVEDSSEENEESG